MEEEVVQDLRSMDTDAWKAIWKKVLAYRKLKAQADALDDQMKNIKAELGPLVEAHGKWKDSDGYVRLVERKPSVAFDAKAIEALYQSVEAIRKALAPHRKAKAGYSYLQIK